MQSVVAELTQPDLLPHEKRALEAERQRQNEWRPPRPSKHPPADVTKPPHYIRNGMECIDVIRAMLGTDGAIAYERGCIAKYNWRLLDKADPLKDAQKIRQVAEFLVADLERKAQETQAG